MDENWILANFKDLLDRSGDNVILRKDTQGTHSISVAGMAALFGSVSPVTHAALSATPQASAGWQRYFDDWKARGLVS